MRTDLYLLTSLGRTAADLTIGTFCHENGHLLCRFPDMYDYGERDGDTTASAGIGNYCLMGSGNHLDFGRSPSPVCAYLRDLAGWCDNEVDLGVAGPYEAKHGDYNTVMKFHTSKPNEYFLVENRSKMDLDRGGSSSGLAVYHCDILGSNELQQGTATRHYQCALLQADGEPRPRARREPGRRLRPVRRYAGIALSGDVLGRTRGSGTGAIPAWSSPTSRRRARPSRSPSAPARRPRRPPARPSPMLAIPDNTPTGVSSAITITAVGDSFPAIKVGVNIKHPYIGDLRVTLSSPGGKVEMLHAQLGGSNDNLVATYDSASPGVLAAMLGQPMKGDWVLNVSDRAARDVGKFKSWKIDLKAAPMGSATNVVAGGKTKKPRRARRRQA